jgi:glycosyltransferase involved in cell wall biosynthesis
MKIAIDASSVVYGTGVSVYTTKLVKNLLAVDKKNKYLLYGGSLRMRGELTESLTSFAGSSSSQLERKVLPIPPTLADLMWNRLHILPIERLLGKIDVFHSSDWTQPPAKAWKVTTIHDIAPLKYPEYSHPKIVSVHRRKMYWVRREVDKIIVPSLATKNDLLDFGIEKKRIVVIQEAANFGLSDRKSVDAIKKKYKIKGRYLLSVGISPRKNSKRIISAFKRIEKNIDLKLVLVGRPVSVEVKSEKGIFVLGHVDNEEISALYTGAEALVFPSLYEGFGIPILDAFNCETPVVTSNVSSMQEVAGDAAMLVNPYSVDSIAKGIQNVIKYRRKYVEKGSLRVNKFSWKKLALQTLEVYKNCSVKERENY